MDAHELLRGRWTRHVPAHTIRARKSMEEPMDDARADLLERAIERLSDDVGTMAQITAKLAAEINVLSQAVTLLGPSISGPGRPVPAPVLAMVATEVIDGCSPETRTLAKRVIANLELWRRGQT